MKKDEQVKVAAEFLKQLKQVSKLNKMFWKKYDKEYKKREKTILVGG